MIYLFLDRIKNFFIKTFFNFIETDGLYIHDLRMLLRAEVNSFIPRLNRVKRLSNEEVVTKTKYKNGYTLVQLAIKRGHLDLLKALIGAFAPYHDVDKNGNNILHLAVKSGNVLVIEYLLGIAISRYEKNYQGKTPWDLASKEIRNAVPALAADYLSTDMYSLSLDAIDVMGYQELIDYVIYLIYKFGFNPNIEHFRYLFTNILNVDMSLYRNTKSITPIFIAFARNHPELVDLFLELGSDIENPIHKNSILFGAVISGKLRMVDKALELGCEVEISTNSKNQTPLHIAILKGYTDIVKRLIAAGADVNRPDSNGNTPAHWACLTDNVEMLLILEKAHAEGEAKNNMGFEPFNYLSKKALKQWQKKDPRKS